MAMSYNAQEAIEDSLIFLQETKQHLDAIVDACEEISSINDNDTVFMQEIALEIKEEAQAALNKLIR